MQGFLKSADGKCSGRGITGAGRRRSAPRPECKNERSDLFAGASPAATHTLGHMTGIGRRGGRDKSRTRKKSLRLIFALRMGSDGGWAS
ncbi:MAG: hypothetical protein B6245_02075 [Desulfobacteraceae bacterium 4572_88]|nr:MAG: hypothetical protein B6245_02075 [Desulfobacteraceae bacterium 4572_88]